MRNYWNDYPCGREANDNKPTEGLGLAIREVVSKYDFSGGSGVLWEGADERQVPLMV